MTEGTGTLLFHVWSYRYAGQGRGRRCKRVSGVEVTVKRVPETMPDEAFKNAGGKQDYDTLEATPQELADYDAIIFGTPTRFGNMVSQMRTFLDQTGGLWANGALRGKVASVFTSTGTGGGDEMTITSTWIRSPTTV